MKSNFWYYFLFIIFAPFGLGVLWLLSYIYLEPYETITRFLAAVVVIMTVVALLYRRQSRSESQDPSQLTAELKFYEDLFTNSPLPYVTINDAGQILSGNSAAIHLLEVTFSSIKSLNLFSLLSSEEDTLLPMIKSKVAAGVAVHELDLQLTTNNQSKRWVTISVHTNQATDQRFVSMVDITEKKRVDIAKSEFASLVTHQLRTPVAAMRWNAELLEQTLPQPVSEMQQKYLEKVKRNITRMLDLINDFLSVSKLETGTFETSPETIELATYFDSIIDEYAGLIKEKNLQITRSYNPTATELIIDTRLLHIVTSNLMSNAVKYTPNEGRVSLSYTVANNRCLITVTDTGIGIPKSDQTRLFNKFFRADNAIKHRAEGTGLGLYIVQQSVQKLGGTISFTSTEEVGTSFSVDILVNH